MRLHLWVMSCAVLMGVVAYGQGVRKVAARDHVLIAKDDGSVWGFGQCAQGQLGEALADRSYVRKPVQLAVPGKVMDVAVGLETSFALLEDGTVLSWGQDVEGALGRGPAHEVGRNRKPDAKPGPVPGLRGVVQIKADGKNALALDSSGTVWAWGPTMVRDMRSVPAVRPAKVEGLPEIASVAIGYSHALAVAKDGGLYGWGMNGHGELGDGTVENRAQPMKVSGIGPVVSACAGFGNSAAVLADGTVRVWGGNASATMGNGQRVSEIDEPGAVNRSPVVVAGVNGAKAVTCGMGTVYVVMKDGSMRVWGHDGYGQGGIGTSGGYQPSPVKTKLAGVREVFPAGVRCYAVTNEGTLYFWGMEMYQMLNVLKTGQKVPVVMDGW